MSTLEPPASETSGLSSEPTEPTTDSDTSGPEAKKIPDLPRALTDVWPVVAVGTGLWLIAFIVLLARYLLADGAADIWLWTAVAGVVISGIGIGILGWQRAAARRGSRSAQKVL